MQLRQGVLRWELSSQMFKAEAGGAGGDQCSVCDAGAGEERVPVCRAKGTAKGDGAIVHAEGIPAEYAAEQQAQGLNAKYGGESQVKPGGAGGAGEIVDEPPKCCGGVLPA